jgi:hypothetical protein
MKRAAKCKGEIAANLVNALVRAITDLQDRVEAMEAELAPGDRWPVAGAAGPVGAAEKVINDQIRIEPEAWPPGQDPF